MESIKMSYNRYLTCKNLVLFLSFLFLVACTKTAEYEVDPQFEPYVQRFIEDARSRGKNIDFTATGLSIIFESRLGDNVAGVCRGKHDIEIVRSYWNGLNDTQKEGLIYHELGHCELKRPHKNNKLKNGEWASRMRGSPIPDGDNAVINYSGSRRDYYINELFNPDTPEPDWSSWRDEYESVRADQKNLVYNTRNEERFEAFVNDLFHHEGNFEISYDMDVGQTEGLAGMSVLGFDNNNRIRIGFNAFGQFFVDSGPNVWGIMYFKENLPELRGKRNTLTLRRKAEFYYVFVNQKFVYWFDYKQPGQYSIASLNTGRAGEPIFYDVSVYTF